MQLKYLKKYISMMLGPVTSTRIPPLQIKFLLVAQTPSCKELFLKEWGGKEGLSENGGPNKSCCAHLPPQSNHKLNKWG